MAAARAIGAGVAAAVLWVLTALLTLAPGGARPLGWIQQVLVPGVLGTARELPSLWPVAAVGVGAVLLGALVAGAALLARGPARIPVVWLAVAVGSVVVATAMGIGTILGEESRLGISYPLADVARDLGIQAWGILVGWIPALVAGGGRERAFPPRTPATVTAIIAGLAAIGLVGTLAVAAPLRFPIADVPAVPAPTATASAPAAPGYPVATTTCAVGALVVVSSGTDGGLGHRAYTVTVRNGSDRSCTLTGYPLFGFRDAHDKAVTATVEPGPSYLAQDPGPVPVTLAPNAQAVASVSWDAGAEPSDPSSAHHMVVTIAQGAGPIDIATDPLDVVDGTATTVQAWRIGATDAMPG